MMDQNVKFLPDTFEIILGKAENGSSHYLVLLWQCIPKPSLSKGLTLDHKTRFMTSSVRKDLQTRY